MFPHLGSPMNTTMEVDFNLLLSRKPASSFGAWETRILSVKFPIKFNVSQGTAHNVVVEMLDVACAVAELYHLVNGL